MTFPEGSGELLCELRTERVSKLAATLAGLVAKHGVVIDIAALDQAALLAKTDLTSELSEGVYGIAGWRWVGCMRGRRGFSAAVGDAIYAASTSRCRWKIRCCSGQWKGRYWGDCG